MFPNIRIIAIVEAVVCILVGGVLLIRPGSPPMPINTIVGGVAIVVGIVGAAITVLSPTLPLPPPKAN